MATPEEVSLDEIVWRSAAKVQELQGIHTNTVLPYFADSPFFDRTSNNATLTTQAFYNPAMFHILQTRQAFEDRLKSMAGVEFMVAHDPSSNSLNPVNSGVWVIRKQNRRKRPGSDDEVTPLSLYYVVGENVYMASSVANILESRMLSTVTALTKFFSTASALPIFTPSLGYTYLPPVPKPVSGAPSLQATQASKESTPMPDTQASGKSNKTAIISESASISDFKGSSLLAESFNLSNMFRNEYMDENPLVGEPGSFVLQKSREAALQSQSQSNSQSTAKSITSVKPSAPPTPAPLKTEGLPPEVKKGVKGGEKTPITPGTKDKKRKKSKAHATTPK
ncbi:Mediator of RNA polymerase II transcription subunit 6 [Lambiella insularis]|nr:Mediator of RNA polymerase II transcription subunit 6 [Lambiella insularis]